MSTIQQRARDAQTLLSEQSALPAVLEEIRQEAIGLFLSSGGDPDKLAAAFRKIEAVATLQQALGDRLNDLALAEHKKRKGQHRGND